MAPDPRFPDEVDFVLTPADVESSDEELLQRHAARHRAPRRHGLRAVALVVGALLVALVAVIAVNRPDGSPEAHPSVTPSVSTVTEEATSQLSFAPVSGPRLAIRHEQTAVILIPVPSASTAAPPAPGPACRTADLCRTSDTVAAPVLRALRARFPGIAIDSSSTELTGGSVDLLRLRSRTVVAHTPVESIIVRVEPSEPGDRTQVSYAESGSGVSVTVSNAQRPWTVTVMVRNPRSLDPDTQTPSALAADRRLLTS